MITIITTATVIAVVILTICLPSLMGALFRLAASTAATGRIALGVGLFFAILTEALGSTGTGLVAMIHSTQRNIMSDQLMGVMIILMVVIKVGLFAALAILGVDVVDRRRIKQLATK